MDDVTWAAARAAQAVSRHLNAAESEAATFSARLRREAVTALDAAVPANEARRVPMGTLEHESTAELDGSRSAA